MIFGSGSFGSVGLGAGPLRHITVVVTSTNPGGGGYGGKQAAHAAQPQGWDDDDTAEWDGHFLIQQNNNALIHVLLGMAASGALQ